MSASVTNSYSVKIIPLSSAQPLQRKLSKDGQSPIEQITKRFFTEKASFVKEFAPQSFKSLCARRDAVKLEAWELEKVLKDGQTPAGSKDVVQKYFNSKLIEFYKLTRAILEIEKANLQSSQKEAGLQIDQAQGRVNDLEKEKRGLSDKVDEQSKRIKLQEDKLAAQEAQIATLTLARDEALLASTRNTESFEIAEQANQELRTDLKMSRDQTAALTGRCQDLAEQLKAKEASIESLKRQIEKQEGTLRTIASLTQGILPDNVAIKQEK